MIKLNKYNLVLTIRRIVGIFILSVIGYLGFIFFIKLICLVLYKGVTFIDALFASLV